MTAGTGILSINGRVAATPIDVLFAPLMTLLDERNPDESIVLGAGEDAQVGTTANLSAAIA